MSLNFKHLRYFWAVAHSGNLTRAARQMHVSQSALSVQIKNLESWLGQTLFDRRGNSLVLTEAGKIALDHADTIFGVGDELVSSLRGRDVAAARVLRVGVRATLSRNFLMRFLEPLFDLDDTLVIVRSAGHQELLTKLEAHELDVVLTNLGPPRDGSRSWQVNEIDKQDVSLIGYPGRVRANEPLEDTLAGHTVVLPTIENGIRIGFDSLCDELGVQPNIRAEIDDMALLRLMVRANVGLGVVPPIVVSDELESGKLVRIHDLEGLSETFYAITLSQRLANPLLRETIDNMRNGTR